MWPTDGMDAETAKSLAASSFAASTMFAPKACIWVVSEIAVALGLSDASAVTPPAARYDPAGLIPPGQPLKRGATPDDPTVLPAASSAVRRDTFPHLGGRAKLAAAAGAILFVAAAIWLVIALVGGPSIPGGNYPNVRAVIEALKTHSTPCANVRYISSPSIAGARDLADCSGHSAGDTSIAVFVGHRAAVKFADRMSHQPAFPGSIEEVLGGNWVVNTDPAYGNKVASAIGGRIIKSAS